MISRRTLLPTAFGTLLFLGWLQSPAANPARRSTSVPREVFLVGAGSCSAAACHNSQAHSATRGGEYGVWIARDRHARAYAVLFDERAELIQKLRNAGPPHEDRRCLDCHVLPHLDIVKSQAPHFKLDGVSCEACHGPAGAWVALHHLDSWKSRSAADKAQLGMRDTRQLPGRIEVCVQCHVGAPGMDVDHELIAAGHPRLHFEFTAFHQLMPHHWPDAGDRDPHRGGRKDFELHAWTLGQVVSARAALELLAARASGKSGSWPELAEHDCFACHHDLQDKVRRQRRPGSGQAPLLPPNLWYLARAGDALQLLDAGPASSLETIEAAWSNPKKLAKKALDTAAVMRRALKQSTKPIAAEDAWRVLLRERGDTWDAAAQQYLALAAWQRAQRDSHALAPPALAGQLQGMFRLVEFPRGYGSPKNFDADTVRKLLPTLKNIGAGIMDRPRSK